MGGTGQTITFGQLDARSNRVAQLFRSLGLERGGSVAILLENHPRFLEVAWAAQRSGLYYTAINIHLTIDEAAYIVARLRREPRRVVRAAGGGRRRVHGGCRAPRRPSSDGRRCRRRLGALRGGRRASAFRAGCRRVRGRLHALLLGHDRAPEGHPAPADVRADGRGHPGRGPVPPGARDARRRRVPVPRAAVPRRTTRLVRSARSGSARRSW